MPQTEQERVVLFIIIIIIIIIIYLTANGLSPSGSVRKCELRI
jgi:t-SNARE complex subunit (syntaxin)